MSANLPLQHSARNALLTPFLARAAATPDAIAVRTHAGDVSYLDLLDAMQRKMSVLDAAGIVPDSVVAFAANRTADTYALLLATLASGAAYLPFDATQAAARIDAMLQDAQPALLVADHALHAGLEWDGNWVDSGIIAPLSRADVKPSGRLAYVLFTSGSSGRPKGVAMGSASVAALMDWHARHARLGRAARTLQFAPLTFDVSFQEILSTLGSGGTLIVPDEAQRRDPWALLELLGQERVERLFLPFVALNALADAALDRPDAIPNTLRDVITAGEALRVTPALRALFSALPDCVLHNHYGPTETHVVTTYELTGDPAAWPELPPIGTALPHVRTRLQAQSQAAGGGELLLGGACLAEGYVGQPELTAQRFVESQGQRWYRTGDRVRRNREGEFEYLGRLDDQIKIAGVRVEPGEIESVLESHARVAHAVVVADGGHDGVHLVAHVVPHDDAGDDTLPAQLAQHCEQALPPPLRPRSFVLHAALPTTASGKVDRRALARQQDAAPLQWDERAPLQAQLLRLWQQLLDGAPLQPSSNLFDAGARSLTVVHALTELRHHGRVMSVAQAYENPTVAAQAALLEGHETARSDALQPRERAQRQHAAFAQFSPPRLAQ